MKKELTLKKSMLEKASSIADVFEIEPFKNNFVKNYEAINGKTDGLMVWEREKLNFLQAISSNKKLAECNRLSIYATFIELAVSGLTLNDQQAYIIPYGNQAQFQIGWRGRLEQISQLETIQQVGHPQVVYEDDEFDYELGGLNAKIIKHKPAVYGDDEKPRIIFVYLVYKQFGEEKSIIMTREECHKIRDRFSKSYGYWKSKGGEKSNVETPFWVEFEAEAFKKTIVKRLYKNIPKSRHLQHLDDRIKDNEDVEEVNYTVVDDSLGEEAKVVDTPAKTVDETETF